MHSLIALLGVNAVDLHVYYRPTFECPCNAPLKARDYTMMSAGHQDNVSVRLR